MINHFALWFITIFSMSLASVTIIAYSKELNISYKSMDVKSHLNIQFLNYILIILSLIIFVGICLLLRFATKSYSSANYLNEWMMIPNFIALDRYAGHLNYPFVIKYSLYLIYPANLLGGLLLGINDNYSIKRNIFLMLPLFGAIVLGIIEGARTSIILGIVLFFSAWLSTLMFSLKRKNTVKKITKSVAK